jgi:fructokinase
VSSGRVVCLGEALVDLVGGEPAASVAAVREFAPAPGGSLANVAAVAARFGARSLFLGGAGDDAWGRWLRERLAAEGVDTSRFVLAEAGETSLAFVAHSPDGEPDFLFYEGSERPAAHAAGDIEAALAGEPGTLVLGSDTLIGAGERQVTMRAAELGRELGWVVLADPNLRPARWPSADEMAGAVAGLVAAAGVLKCNEAEAFELTGEADAESAARALRERGPVAVIVTRSGRGALLAAGDEPVGVAAPESRALDATGAGDSVTGVLAAAVAARGVAALKPALAVAMRTAAGVVAAPGALAGLPPAAEAVAALDAALADG